MADFDKISKWYDSAINQFYFNIIHKKGIDFISEYLKPQQRFLDIACGTGNWLLKLKNKYNIDLNGCDESEGMINVARNKIPNINFKTGSAENLPFRNEEFDFISIIEAFHHFKDHEKSILEAKRVLKSKGYFFFLDPVLDGPLKFIWVAAKALTPFEKDSKFFHLKELALMLEKSGFKILKAKSKLGNAWVLAQKI